MINIALTTEFSLAADGARRVKLTVSSGRQARLQYSRRCGGCGGVLRTRLRFHAGGRWREVSHMVPLTEDGLIYASSMVMLDSARRRTPVPALARCLLGLGIATTRD